MNIQIKQYPQNDVWWGYIDLGDHVVFLPHEGEPFLYQLTEEQLANK